MTDEIISRETLEVQLKSKLKRKKSLAKLVNGIGAANPALHNQLTNLEKSIVELIIVLGGEKLGIKFEDLSDISDEKLMKIIEDGKGAEDVERKI